MAADDSFKGVWAATLICLREGADGRMECLVGQGEVVNCMRSTPDKTVAMRFPGEMKFPGGTKDKEDPDLCATALRELSEEFWIDDVSGVSVFPFKVKTTTAGSNNTVYKVQSHVAFVDEHPKLNVDTAALNLKLADRRAVYQQAVASGEYYGLDKGAKEKISPEVHEVRWIALEDAIALSDCDGYINDWQKAECTKHNIARERADNTILTMREVLELKTIDGVKAYAKSNVPASM